MHIQKFLSDKAPYNISIEEINLFKASNHSQIILNNNQEDVLTNIQTYLEKVLQKDIYDQNGGEFLSINKRNRARTL